MGKFDTHGGRFAPQGYFKVEEGGSHEENPNGGVQVGVDPNGIPNMLEENEPVYNDYVYSDNIHAEKDILEQFNIPSRFAGKLYSEIADEYVTEAENRPLDPISNNGLNAMLVRLANAQEAQKQRQQEAELEEQLSQMSPEELAQLESILVSQEQTVVPDEQEVQAETPVIAQEQMVPQPQVMKNGGAIRRFDNGTPGQIVIPKEAPNTGEIRPDYRLRPIVDISDTSLGRGLRNFRNSGLGSIVDLLLPKDASSLAVAGPMTKIGVGTAELAAQYEKEAAAGKKLIADLESKISGIKAGTVKEDLQVAKKALADAKSNLKFNQGEAARIRKSIGDGLGWDWKTLGKIGAGAAGAGLTGLAVWDISKELGSDNVPVSTDRTVNVPMISEEPYNDEYQSSFKHGGAINKFDGLTRGTNWMDRYMKPNGGLHFYQPGPLVSFTDDIEPAVVSASVDDIATIEPAVVTESYDNVGNILSPATVYPTVNGGVIDPSVASITRLNPSVVTGTRTYPLSDDFLEGSLYDWRGWGTSAQNRLGGRSKFNQTYPSAPYFWPRITNNYPAYSIFTDAEDVVAGNPEIVYSEELEPLEVIATRNAPAARGPVSSGSGIPATSDRRRTTSSPTVVTPEVQPSTNARRIPLDTPVFDFTGFQRSLKTGQPVDTGKIDVALDPRLSGTATTYAPTSPTVYPIEREQAETRYPEGVLPTGLRYAGAGLAGIEALANLGEQPYRFNNTLMRPYLSSGRMDLQRMRYRPADINALVAESNNANAGTMNTIRNSGLGPSTAGAILGADRIGTQARGDAFLRGWAGNNDAYNSVIAGNNQASAQEAQFDYGVDSAVANILNNYAQRRAMMDMQNQLYAYQDDLNRGQAIGSNLDALAEALAGTGYENFVMNELNHNRALYDRVHKSGASSYKGAKYGGTLLRKYKK